MVGTSIRPALHADDRWYPASAASLRRDVESYIERSPRVALPGKVVALIVPHAGYFFSGHVAGAGYRQVQAGDYDTVVLVGPDHTGVAFGELAIPAFDAWRTPLGDVIVDVDLVAELVSRLPLRRVGRETEHSLEVQLPFLQVALSNFRLLPVMMGSQSPAACRALGEAIAEVVDQRKVLLVASTDLCHFQPDSATRRIDAHTVQFILNFDVPGLLEALREGTAQACGGGPVAAVMIAAARLGADQAHQIKYATSADVWEDRSRVVGYVAIALTKPERA